MSGFNLDIAETTAKFLDSNATVANQFQGRSPIHEIITIINVNNCFMSINRIGDEVQSIEIYVRKSIGFPRKTTK